jgi:hypothetical protein
VLRFSDLQAACAGSLLSTSSARARLSPGLEQALLEHRRTELAEACECAVNVDGEADKASRVNAGIEWDWTGAQSGCRKESCVRL